MQKEKKVKKKLKDTGIHWIESQRAEDRRGFPVWIV